MAKSKTETTEKASAKGKADPRKATSYIVKTKTYQETFTNLDDAKSKYEDLKTHATKNKQATNIKLFSRIGGTTNEVCGVAIKGEHFEEE